MSFLLEKERESCELFGLCSTAAHDQQTSRVLLGLVSE